MKMKTLAAGKGTGILKSLALVLAISMVCTFFTGCGSRQDYASAVTLTAPSAVKTYDGSPLLPGEVEVSGLPEGYTVEAAVTGSQTDAGSSTSAVEQYVITNAKGKDRTKKFKDVTLVEGTLTVEPAEVTIATAGASKAYDASPLTASEVELTGIVESDVVVTATGSQLNVGSSENGYEINWGSARSENYVITEILGTLTVEPAQVTITTASGTKTYDGTELTGSAEISGVLEEGVTVTATGSQLNVGSSENGYEIDWGEANPDNYKISEELGTLTVEPAQVTITTASGTKTYDGTELTGSADISGVLEEGVTVTATGSQLNVGSSENGYEIDWGDANPENYEISEELGTLTVEPAQVTITTAGGTKTYDGTELTGSADISGVLEEGVSVTATGSQLNVGSSENGYEIDWGEANPENYEISEELGTLTVEPAQVNITTGSDTGAYNGTGLEAGVEVSGIVENDVTVTATGSQLNVGSSENGYEIDWGSADPNNYEISEQLGTLTVEPAQVSITTGSETGVYSGTGLSAGVEVSGIVENDVTVTATGSQLNVGSSENGYEIDWGSADPANYVITENLGTLTVEPAQVTITTASASKPYDGTELTAGVEVSGILEDGVTVSATGSQLNVGSSENGYEIDWGSADPANYEITTALGTLTVEPAPVLIRTGSAWKTYDAEVLTSDYVSVTGVVEDGVAVTATGSLLNAGSCVNTYEIDWGNADPANYTVTEELGSLTIDPCPLTIVTHSATKRFDGTPLTCRKTSIICPIETDIWAGGTGAQLYVGSCYNSVAYDWGTQDPNNFDLHVIYGQLIVTP